MVHRLGYGVGSEADAADDEDGARGVGDARKLDREDPKLGAATLLLLTEETWRLRDRNRRKPTPIMVRAAMRVAGDIAERDRVEAAADRVAAHFAELQLGRRVAAAAAAARYIEASAA